MNARENEVLLELLSALADDRLDPAGEDRLAALLLADPEARALYRKHCHLHADLVEFCGGREELPTHDDGPTDLPEPAAGTVPAEATRQRRTVWVAGLILAAGALLMLGIFRPRPDALPVADRGILGEVVAAEGAVWDLAEPPRPGTKIRAGRCELSAGRLSLRLENGVELTFPEPGRFDLHHLNHVTLLAGRVAVRCDEDRAIGFRVGTASAEVLDLGTEFGVAVDPSGASEVHVFEGLVVARRKGSDLVVPLRTQEAGRFAGETGDLDSIACVPERFGRAVAAPPAPSRPLPPGAARPAPLPPEARIVVLGDRVSDRETYLLLVAEALERIDGARAPRLFNAAVSVGWTWNEAGYEKYVAPHRPTHALLAFGVEAACHDRLPPAAEGVARLAETAARLQALGIEPILVTAYPLPPNFAHRQERLDDWNRGLRALAAERGYRLADADARFRRAPAQPTLVAAPDFVPTFAGCRELAAVVLESLGRPEVAVADRLEFGLLPGVIPEWRLRRKPAGERLTDAAAAALRPDETWETLRLPQDDPLSRRLPIPSRSISFQDRRRGFATHLHFDPDSIVEGVAVLDSPADRPAFLNTGTTLRRVWVNGERVFDQPAWTGWHAGKERVPVRLRQGRNVLVIEAKNDFFLSVTDTADWSLRAAGGVAAPTATGEDGR